MRTDGLDGGGKHQNATTMTFARRPVRVYWELTRACDLACRHCRAEANPTGAPDELATETCLLVLGELARESPRPHVVFTGGDPLKRPDLLTLIRAASALDLPVALAPSATPRLTGAAVRQLKSAGISAMSLSLDGSSPARHDQLRGVPGCFGWTYAAAGDIVACGLPLQINTLVCRETEADLEEIAEVVARLGASRWSLFFLVSVGRGRALRSLDSQAAERVLHWLARRAGEWPFTVSTTEAPHYRRVLIERLRAEGRTGPEIRQHPIARSFGIRDGNGIMFIAANGDVTPSGFLSLVAGNVRRGNVLDIYRDAPLFRTLRKPQEFRGRCGRCSFRSLCGGSRGRAWASSGDVMGEDPLCAYQPSVSSGHDSQVLSASP